MEIIYIFSNTHMVISAEQVLLRADLPVKVMPVPNAITAGCGLCLRVLPGYREQAEIEMMKQSIVIAAIYERKGGKYKLLRSM